MFAGLVAALRSACAGPGAGDTDVRWRMWFLILLVISSPASSPKNRVPLLAKVLGQSEDRVAGSSTAAATAEPC